MGSTKAKFIIMLSFVALVFGSYLAFYTYQNRQIYQTKVSAVEGGGRGDESDNEMSQDHDTNPSDHDTPLPDSDNKDNDFSDNDNDANPNPTPTTARNTCNVGTWRYCVSQGSPGCQLCYAANTWGVCARQDYPGHCSAPTPTRVPTSIPTGIPTSTPIPSTTATPTQAGCPLKNQGDANCDGAVNQTDYFYYVLAVNGGTLPAGVNCDFNGDGEVGAKDRAIIINTLNNQ